MASFMMKIVAVWLSLLVTTDAMITSPRPVCKATGHWPGFSNLKNTFIFGDSYTSIGFNQTGYQPTPTNPLGNPTYPGWTSSNGPNWIDFLTVKYNESSVLTYNLAYGGATLDSALVAPYLPVVSSVAEQVDNEWFPTYGGKSALWSDNDTLFAFFDGINDVVNSYYNGADATNALYANIFAIYRGLVDELYYAGGRNFAFLNVPPTQRSPLITGAGQWSIDTITAAILTWNTLLTQLANNVKTSFPDTNVFTVDANKVFTEVLDNPKRFAATAGYLNTTEYCDGYQNGTPVEDTLDPSCGIPVNQYFWLNSLHPTYPMQDVLAQEVASVLKAGPNAC
ncbi:hypothetical protein BJ878DRAFT_84410 [Calycina marina]|uniref:Carbohydrate esterase family 16 protein n=1 Tax=Calycina marina TaxID=1763456 RepID=A0A9P7Z2G0_9HELO|nr:hypothetical protein BJ878DRAFT_84410 [Calycina marina]